MTERERGKGPMFLYVYLTVNHQELPVPRRLLPDWHSRAQPPEVDEYLRRQAASRVDYPIFWLASSGISLTTRSWYATATTSPISPSSSSTGRST
jgi:hypothetical protein